MLHKHTWFPSANVAGSVFGRVCLSACVSVCLSCARSNWWKLHIFVRKYLSSISRSSSYIKVIRSRSRSKEQTVISSISMISIIPTARPIFPTVNCRSPVVSSCCSHHMELSPSDVQSSSSLSIFRRHLKTFLFHKSFPDVLLLFCFILWYAFVYSEVAVAITSHDKNSDWHK